jgi:hypothetical protein
LAREKALEKALWMALWTVREMELWTELWMGLCPLTPAILLLTPCHLPPPPVPLLISALD